MTLHRRATRRDANEADIVDALRAAGCNVERLDQPVDLLVGRAGVNYLLEVKDGTRRPSERKLTDEQEEFFKVWRGQVLKVESPEDALRAVGLVR